MTIEQANQYFAALPDGFASTEQLRAAFTAPVQKVQFVGVAGTAGKTVTARLLAAILHAQGIHAGLYHAGCRPLSERICIDDAPVDEGLLALTADALSAAEALPQDAAELAAAANCFGAAGCTLAVVELPDAGLAEALPGMPVCAVTSVGPDGVSRSVERLAALAAGVMRKESICVTAPEQPKSVLSELIVAAGKCGCELVVPDPEDITFLEAEKFASKVDYGGYTVPLAFLGRHAAGSAAMGQPLTLTVTRPGYGYSCAFSYTFAGVTGTPEEAAIQAVSSSADRVVYQWTVPTGLMTRIPNATSGSGTMTARVYSGGTYIGSVSAAFTLYVPDSVRPEAAVTATVVNDNAVLQGWGLCVQGMSRVQYSISATMKGGASLQSSQFRFAGETKDGASGTVGPVSGSGVQTPQATVTDSRGRSISVSGTAIRVYEYSPPVITSSMAVRCNELGEARDDGKFFKLKCAATCSPLAGQNEVTVRVQYRPMGGGVWSGGIPIENGAEVITGGNMDESCAYEIELSAEDTVGTVRTVRYTSATKQVTVHLRSGGTGLALGKYAEKDGLECAWPASFYGDVAVSGSLKLNGVAVEEKLFPVGSVRLTATADAPELPGTWQQVQAGLSGVYAWRRVT